MKEILKVILTHQITISRVNILSNQINEAIKIKDYLEAKKLNDIKNELIKEIPTHGDLEDLLKKLEDL